MKHPIKLTSSEFTQNTHEHFAWMRREAPVYKARMTRWKDAYLITRYDDVVAMIMDERIVKNPQNVKESGNGMVWMPKAMDPLMHNMLNSDEPDHRRLRNLVHKAFTPRMIMALAPRIEAITNELVDEMMQKEEVELIRDLALPLPTRVIAEMMGIPMEEREAFRRFTSRFLVNPTPVNMIKAIPAVFGYFKYIRGLAAKRRVKPQDDLLTALVQAEEDGDRFTEDELLGMTFLLLVAGHETTVNLIANGTLALLQNPDQLALLQSDPGLMETAVEEFLRYDGPLLTTEASFAKEPITLHSVTMPQGALILPAILSANRDETVFENPDQLDIRRTPNKHLAFGKGIHYCLGAPLARLEGKIAFCTLLHRCPNLRLNAAPEQLRYLNMLIVHRLEALPVAV
jgi:cytochrome P450 PksS